MGPWVPFIAIAYLAGSIPFGVLIARAKGIDIRQHGSKNVGATNVGRVLGKRLGMLCFFLDAAKGALPVLGAGFATSSIGTQELAAVDAWMWLAIVAAAMFGHMFPIWLRFKGGKGVATGLGALLALYPVMTISAVGAFILWVAIVKVFRYVGVASCAGALSLPLWVFIADFAGWTGQGDKAPFYIASTLLAAVVIIKHRGNLSRTLAGTEPKVGTPMAEHENPPTS